jgi:hypothetical protein
MTFEGPAKTHSGESDVRSKLLEAFRKTKTETDPARPLIPAPTLVKEATQPPVEPRSPILDAISAARPPDVGDSQWKVAMRGLEAFLAAGHAAEAERLGWPPNELYGVPPVWARVELCGAGLLVGDRQVTAITTTEIRVKTSSGSSLAFYRRPEVDFALIFESRRQLLAGSVGSGEARLRAREWAVREYRRLHSVTLEVAKQAVDAIIAANEKRP